MRRRGFLASVTGLGIWLCSRGFAAVTKAIGRKANPYAGQIARIDPLEDEFACEKRAAVVEKANRELLEKKAFPLDAGFSGKSPKPVRYLHLGMDAYRAQFWGSEDFATGLRRWIETLGTVRRANFSALPGDLVRYEIAGHDDIGLTYRVGVWKQVWRGDRLNRFEPVSEQLTRAKEPFFRDVTGHAFAGVASFDAQLRKGNPHWRARMDLATGIDVYGNNGVAVGDIDGDGREEIYVCQPGGLPNRLYKMSEQGRLEDITERSGVGVLDDTTSALFVDFRNSGHQDLVVLRTSGPLLFLNDGAGNFRHVEGAFHFANAPQGSFTGMAAADYDRDGMVDLYVCCYVYFQSEDQYRYPAPYHDARNGPPNFLFRNRLNADGTGFLEDATEASGINHNNDRYSFAPAWCDSNGDGWPDLYVANDFGRNNFYRNRGGKFRDEADKAGVDDVGPGMSASWFDYDGDGQPDLYISNMWSAAGQRVSREESFGRERQLPVRDFRRHAQGNSLYRNSGGRFEDSGERQGVEMGRWAWNSGGFDFDNDGRPEIAVTCGMLTNESETDLESFFWRQVVAKSPAKLEAAPDYENGWNAINQFIREDKSWSGRQPNVFYARPRGAETYFDFSGVSGFDFADDSRAFAVTDLDGDGNLDLVLKSRLGPQVRMLQNCCGVGSRVVVLHLQGTKSNRDAIGARVSLNGQVKFVEAGSGYLSQHTKELHFGLGEAEDARVKIVWPSGVVEEHGPLAAGHRYRVVEGLAQLSKTVLGKRVEWPFSPQEGENRPEFASTWLLEPVPLPEKQEGPGFLLLTRGEAVRLPAGFRALCATLRRTRMHSRPIRFSGGICSICGAIW